MFQSDTQIVAVLGCLGIFRKRGVCVKEVVLWRDDFEVDRLALLHVPGPKKCEQTASTCGGTNYHSRAWDDVG